MNYRDMTDSELANFAANVAFRLSSHKIECLDDAEADKFAELIGPENEAFQADLAEIIELIARKMAVNSRKNERRERILEGLMRTQMALRTHQGAETDFTLCGFSTRRPWSRYQAADPTELSAKLESNGPVKLRFRGNNTRGMVVFEISRRERKKSQWDVIALPTTQRYTDATVMPGVSYEYKVRAVGRNSESNFSNVAFVG